MKMLFVRGAFLNKYEGQNIEPLAKKHKIVGVGSANAIHTKLALPVKQFFSPYDLVKGIGPHFARASWGKEIGERIVRGVCNRTLGDPHFLFGFEEYVRETGPWDVAHIAETYYGYDLQVVRLKREGYIKRIVSTCWETIPFNNESIKKKQEIKKMVKKHIDLFICPTKKAKKALIEEGVYENKIEIVRMGVDLSKFKVKSEKLRERREKTIQILFVGRLIEEKGIQDLMKAYKSIDDQKMKAVLRIAGSGPLEKELRREILSNKKYQFITIKKKRYAQMAHVYQEADILAFPSRTSDSWEEQYGMALVEAMASGMPIVAYDSGAISEVVGNSGILVSEGDVDGFAHALEELIQDPILRHKLGFVGRRRAEREFDRNKIALMIEKLYRTL